jgi:hypothetical protein
MRSLFFFILFTSSALSQVRNTFVLYGNLGVGLSQGEFGESTWGPATRLGVTIGYDRFILKVDRTVNNEIEMFGPPEKISSYSALLGVSFQLFNHLPELRVNGKYGIGKGEMIKRGKVTRYNFFATEYELLTEKYSSTLVEIDGELRFGPVGLSVGWFTEHSQWYTIYGFTVGAIFGIL